MSVARRKPRQLQIERKHSNTWRAHHVIEVDDSMEALAPHEPGDSVYHPGVPEVLHPKGRATSTYCLQSTMILKRGRARGSTQICR